MSALSKAVTEVDEGWDFQCPGVKGSPCGNPDTGRPFVSSGWPTKKLALARGAQHLAEHEGKGIAQELDEFRRDQGLVDSVEDL